MEAIPYPVIMTPQTTFSSLVTAALIVGGFATSMAHAASVVIDFSGTQYADNFTETSNGDRLNNTSGALTLNNAASLAGIAVYNTPFPSDPLADFSVKIDGKFTTRPTSFGGDSVGIMTNLNDSGAGLLAVFRIGGATSADFRLFQGNSSGSLTTPALASQTVSTIAGFGGFQSNTFYTFQLSVSTDSANNSTTLTGSILDAGSGSLIASFNSVVATGSNFIGENGVALRLGTQGNINNYTTVDNFVLTSAASPVPEPAAAALLSGLGVLGLVASRRRRRN